MMMFMMENFVVVVVVFNKNFLSKLEVVTDDDCITSMREKIDNLSRKKMKNENMAVRLKTVVIISVAYLLFDYHYYNDKLSSNITRQTERQ